MFSKGDYGFKVFCCLNKLEDKGNEFRGEEDKYY